MSYDKNNSGTLGKNERKEKENHPDARGQCTIDGVEYWISGWIREGRNGRFTSLSFQRKDQQQPASKPATPRSDDFDDDLPF